MLVLTRRKGEKILVGDDIEVIIINEKNGQIRVGINAPRDMLVVRAELEKRSEKQTLEVSQALPH